MNDVLRRWNSLQPAEAAQEILPCCGSKAWAQAMADRRPIQSEDALLAACNAIWSSLAEEDWREAFRSHPLIGESAEASDSNRSAAWSSEEQRKAGIASEKVKAALTKANRAYEQRFHRIFIVCATNKSAPEILEILRRRLRNDDATELQEAAEQQRQITHLRLNKWLSS
jgi:2-oxo-4-hydroxy-4-carboxy-5-ureidoimidazoline decarboxylase